MKVTRRVPTFVLLALVVVLALSIGAQSVPAQGPAYSVWLVRSSVFKDVPAGAFMPDRAFVRAAPARCNNINTVDLPVNVGVIKCGKEVILYDTGWKQQDYHKMTGTEHWAPLPDQLSCSASHADDVTKIVIGHGHWDHAGQMMRFPERHAVRAEGGAEGHRVGAQLSEPHISAVNTTQGRLHAHARPAAIRRKTLEEIYGKVLAGKAVIVDGEMEIAPGVQDPSGVPRSHRGLAAARGADQHRQAGVRLAMPTRRGKGSATG